jgi:hypothetical protein
VRFRIGQSSLLGDAVDEPPVGIEEICRGANKTGLRFSKTGRCASKTGIQLQIGGS